LALVREVREVREKSGEKILVREVREKSGKFEKIRKSQGK
jgi:hypothetical protein